MKTPEPVAVDLVEVNRELLVMGTECLENQEENQEIDVVQAQSVAVQKIDEVDRNHTNHRKIAEPVQRVMITNIV